MVFLMFNGIFTHNLSLKAVCIFHISLVLTLLTCVLICVFPNNPIQIEMTVPTGQNVLLGRSETTSDPLNI